MTAPVAFAAAADPRHAGGLMRDPQPVLSIVIPALDEEEAIGATVERCLAARATIVAEICGIVPPPRGNARPVAELHRVEPPVDALPRQQLRGSSSPRSW